ncbi:MAG: glycoside hydrolase family 3 N-terminal domain-containing protein [Anaerolineae bacterium]|nr:hypothetical protein [Candidatus Roseilinea sp.]MDW8450322.1 glycoside hydrolase family 3 N-terminal domain-containing protein [Anaerolineae bacterium]
MSNLRTHPSPAQRWLAGLLCLGCLSQLVAPLPARAQDPQPPAIPYLQEAKAIIARMTLAQRVGQLFIVSFPGDDVSPSSDIAKLITDYHIGGVQLRAANRNFDNAKANPPVTQQIIRLTNALQQLAFSDELAKEALSEFAQGQITPTARVTVTASAVPLFIALSQEADWTTRSELSEITQEVTQIPSQMAIGATWTPAIAQTVGEILGGELAQLGINLLFGPTLDVSDTPRPNTPGDLGTHVFGGDPFWVGKMGAAFVAGLHSGSKNRLAAVGKHFPGLGSSDRNVSEEIPTVQKSIEQLRLIELAPFFAVLKGEASKDTTVDGLLVSHIRYRGLQGNIRASTRPVSFDPQAYQALMSLPETAAWRNSGGVTFSDQLGARSVRRFYDPLEKSFNARRIAQEAFMAGNDVLVLGNFGLTNAWPEQLTNITETISFFQTKYLEDKTFAARVDESLTRIISLKLRLYGGRFRLGDVLVEEVEQLDAQDESAAKIVKMAKESITLLSPNARDLPTVLPTQPTKDDYIVFITDNRTIRECAECEPYPAVSRTALEEIALDLYGPRKTEQVDPLRVASFTFSDLADYNRRANVSAATPGSVPVLPTATGPAVGEVVQPTATPDRPPPRIQSAIERATWIIIAVIDTNPAVPSTAALRTFLAQSADILKDKRVIVFALGAPYYLDATEISRTTAYFGVYSRSRPYLEAALRALFGEFPAPGHSPVSINSLGYSLIAQTAPNRDQVIPLVPALANGEPITATIEGTPAPLELKIGDRLRVRAGPIFDLNGRVVPDGTEVQFILSYPAERIEQRLPENKAVTRDGFAETTIELQRLGKLEIRAEADQATTSYTISVNATDNVSVETVVPTPLPAELLQPATTSVASPAPEATLTMPTPMPLEAPPTARPNLTGFLLALIGLLAVSAGVFFVLSQTGFNALDPHIRVRVALGVWVAGWLSYILAALGAPGLGWATHLWSWGGAVLMAVLFALLCAGLALVVILRMRGRNRDNRGRRSA